MKIWKGTVIHELSHLPAYHKEIRKHAKLTEQTARLQFGRHKRQYILVAQPERPTNKWVVYWHGGGWQFGSPEQFQYAAKSWLDKGIGVVLPSYRRIPFHNYSAMEEDTVSGLKAFKHWADEKQNSNIKLIFLGMSAGAHLGALAGLKPTILSETGFQCQQLKGVICCGGVLDLDLMPETFVLSFLAKSKEGKLFTAANPIAHLREDSPKFQLVHGTRDGLVPFEIAQSFSKKYQEIRRKEAPLFVLKNGTHLDAGRWIYRDDETRQLLLKRTEEWFED